MSEGNNHCRGNGNDYYIPAKEKYVLTNCLIRNKI